MTYAIRKMVMVTGLFLVLAGAVRICRADESTYLYDIENTMVERSYHAAARDDITGAIENPFAFTKSSLGRALHATFFLQGYIDAAFEDSGRRDALMNDMDDFSHKISKFYVLGDKAQNYVQREIERAPEEAGYFFENLDHLRQRIILLFESFRTLVDGVESHEIGAVLVNLRHLINEIGQMLAL